MNNWLVASYKINEITIVEKNLKNQKYKFYLPKINTQKLNSNFKEEVLFPGYIFIQTNIDNYSSLRFTRGIKNIIQFGNKISFINDDEIDYIRVFEKKSKNNPILPKIEIGQDVSIEKGYLRGNLVEICSMPANKRIDVLMHILGNKRKVNIPLKELC